MRYELIENDTVFENISKGIKVVCCDFKTGRIMDCNSMTIGALEMFTTSSETAFFKVTDSE